MYVVPRAVLPPVHFVVAQTVHAMLARLAALGKTLVRLLGESAVEQEPVSLGRFAVGVEHRVPQVMLFAVEMDFVRRGSSAVLTRSV